MTVAHCPHPGCTVALMPNTVACPVHMARLSRPMQDRIEAFVGGTLAITQDQLSREILQDLRRKQ